MAGATGAIGRRLVPMLVKEGHNVVAMTRAPEKTRLLEAMGTDCNQRLMRCFVTKG